MATKKKAAKPRKQKQPKVDGPLGKRGDAKPQVPPSSREPCATRYSVISNDGIDTTIIAGCATINIRTDGRAFIQVAIAATGKETSEMAPAGENTKLPPIQTKGGGDGPEPDEPECP